MHTDGTNFTANKTDEVAAETKIFSAEIKEEIKVKNIRNRCKIFLEALPTILVSVFAEAFLIAAYRYEWSKQYRDWNAWAGYDFYMQTNFNERRHRKASATGNRKSIAPSTMQGDHTAKNSVDQNSPNNLNFYKHDHKNCTRVKINVGGRIFETQLRTLQRYPDTLLGNPRKILPFYDPAQGYYFFDRSRSCFEQILYYYQSGGRVVCPLDIHLEEFYFELEFFDIGEEVLHQYRLEAWIDQEAEFEDVILPTNLLQRKIYLLLEFPRSSPQATIVSVLSVCIVLVSVVIFVIETEPSIRIRDTLFYLNNNSTNDDGFDSVDFKDPFFIVEAICVFWFSMELILRFATCPSKFQFVTSAVNIVDFVAIVPFVVNTVIREHFNAGQDYSETSLLAIVRIFRLVRVFRIFKLSRHVKGLKILGWTLQASFNELGLLFMFLIIAVIVFSSAVYFAEDPSKDFPSIPETFFWAVGTMTTVGSEDFPPKQAVGKIVGSLCAIAGVLTLALPVPVMVANFTYFYEQEMSRNRSIQNKHDSFHVQMCPYLPNNGVHPEVLHTNKANTSTNVNEQQPVTNPPVKP